GAGDARAGTWHAVPADHGSGGSAWVQLVPAGPRLIHSAKLIERTRPFAGLSERLPINHGTGPQGSRLAPLTRLLTTSLSQEPLHLGVRSKSRGSRHNGGRSNQPDPRLRPSTRGQVRQAHSGPGPTRPRPRRASRPL